MKKSLLALLILLTAVSVHARKGPNHQAIRALGMGNAFVAVAEDRDAIYYNPAGLNLMGKLGNYDRDPEMGHYPDNWLDMRLSLVTSLLLPDLFGLGIDGWNFYDEHHKTLHKLKNDALEALVADDDFFEGSSSPSASARFTAKSRSTTSARPSGPRRRSARPSKWA